ncbi:Response regulator transcription factor [Burkholderia multivorans]
MIRVAIADSDEGVHVFIRALLEAASDMEAVDETFDTNSMLARLRSTQVDIVMLGLLMTGLHCEGLIRQIKEQRPSLRVIVLTSLATEDAAARAFKAGASGFVAKASPADDLLAAIRQVASGGVYVNLWPPVS